jgi:fumarate reductase subunit C
MNWGQKVSLALLGILALLFVMKHTIVWRQQKRGVRNVWLRAHPMSQMVLLVSVFVVTALAGTGTIL